MRGSLHYITCFVLAFRRIDPVNPFSVAAGVCFALPCHVLETGRAPQADLTGTLTDREISRHFEVGDRVEAAAADLAHSPPALPKPARPGGLINQQG